MDTLGIIRQIEQDPALRAQLRAVLLGDEMLELPDLVRQLAVRVEELAAAQRETAAALRDFAKETERRLEQVDQRLDQVDQRLDQVDQRLEQVDQRLDRLEGDVGSLRGENLEARVRADPGRYLTRRIAPGLVALLEGVRRIELLDALSEEAAEEVLRADAVVEARQPGVEPSLFVVEASTRAHADDLERASRRASLLRQSGLEVRAVVVTQADPGEQLLAAAESQGIVVISESEGVLSPRRPAAEA